MRQQVFDFVRIPRCATTKNKKRARLNRSRFEQRGAILIAPLLEQIYWNLTETS